jgi:hypothetical protein
MVYGLETIGVEGAGITGGGETLRIESGIGALREERNLGQSDQPPHLRNEERSGIVTAVSRSCGGIL